ncbi:hypothetical protein HPB47_001096 [Ixodes persulcatus]|uniref:Uncharacterized protein n=1 Tax=Ixodes persulcatus TaxID=34615 RepID=A0AC60PQ02_IXOPE|nr:hypothetical protein HPB47_001096 [Ixodes persulcatus]
MSINMPAKCVKCGQEHEATARFCSKRMKLGEIQAYSIQLVGDFNAPHSAWGYTRSRAKGTRLYHSICQQRLSILTDQEQPTRTGNSVTHDTCPDLALTRCGQWSEWSNLEENLGSDHAIVQVDIAVSPGKTFLRKQALTDWDRFRAARTATHSEREQNDASLASCTERMVCDKNTYTETINLTTETPEVDRHLLHLWEARHGLIKHWKRQKLYRKLKKRIAAITAEVLEYATQLACSNWNKKCTNLQGTLGTKDAWQFLRQPLDPSKSKSNTSQSLQKIVRDFPGTNQDLLEQLKLRYIGSSPDEEYHDYEGEPSPELDAPISFEEVWSPLQNLGRNKAPGEDRVKNTLIRNLDAGSVQTLLKHINQVWENGELPRECKHSEIILIPKPGKELNLDNLRPIALTSCVGKLMERVVLKRLHLHIEETGVFSHTMLCFREHLSTQDVMLQLKEDILGPMSRTTTQAVLTLDVKGAFDNVGHQLIL